MLKNISINKRIMLLLNSAIFLVAIITIIVSIRSIRSLTNAEIESFTKTMMDEKKADLLAKTEIMNKVVVKIYNKNKHVKKLKK